jgi:hypothetical protein
VLDASRISFCDTGGLRAVVAAAETTRRRGGVPTVTGASRSLRRLLTIVGLADLLPGGAGPDALGRPDAAAGSPSVLPFRTREDGHDRVTPTARPRRRARFRDRT